ncbi:MAG: helix-turn-helix domain-containing protein [Saprospiraceae bacterium]|nr:helix-turn-helix domain-containing protein [Saprospiraceae bacterium]MCF8249169.1 helix-turn-helix domain-containing protein [Saprospiraceae bacterium]MCF8311298.1 helix-turn-helix domain-containing protein [Saprospiraceae bacterium]MCF8440138.1 helix-turn-helix domain-containing protein [Saprospiraceae bacterium]
MITKIRTATEYEQVMQIIEGYLQKATTGGGFQSFSTYESEELQRLSQLAEVWEDSLPIMPLKQPENLPEMIELKMYQLKLKQKDLSELLGIAPSRLSEVLAGKRKINLDLAKRLHERLNIDAGFILKCA